MKERLKRFAKISNYKIIAICLLLLIGIMYYYEEIKETDVKLPSQQVIVLKKDIPANTVIDKSMIELENRFEDKFLKEANIVKSVESIVGKRTKVPLYKGELINNDRLLVNQDYMNEEINKKQISFEINDIDQALNFKKGDFIDVWVIPTSEESKESTRKVFEKLQIIEVVNTEKRIIKDAENKKDEKDSLATYVVLQLSDEAIEELFCIDRSNNEIKISKYKENDNFALVNEKIENQPNETVGKDDINEQGTN